MGRLQDNQYSAISTKKSPKNKEVIEKDRQLKKDELQATFCPPLDASLIEAIWNDSFDYTRSYKVLAELAREADSVLDRELEDSRSNADTSGFSETQSSSDCQTTEEEVDSLEFLYMCFPTVGRAELLETLRSQDNDLEKATDILLNSVYLLEDNDSPSKDDEGSGETVKRSSKKKKKRRKPVIWTSGQLPTGVKPLLENGNEDELFELATVPVNFWHQYDGQIEEIQKVFPRISRLKVLSHVQRCRGNIIAAVQSLMDQENKVSKVLDWQSLKNLEEIKTRMTEILVDRTADDIDAIATGVVIDDLWQRRQQARPQTVDRMVQEGINFALHYAEQQRDLAERMKLLALASNTGSGVNDMPVVPEYLLLDNRKNYTEDDPAECRAMAMSLIMQRNELFVKAAAAYRRAKNKGPGEGGVPFYYSQEAWKLDAQAKEWNMRAARALVRQQRLQQNDDHLLDLHGLTVAEAQVLIKEGVNQWWSRSITQSARRRIQPLKIVTGVGKHSADGQSKLMPMALKLLNREGWQVQVDNPGCILVKGLKQQQPSTA